jgi:hypothetical protein
MVLLELMIVNAISFGYENASFCLRLGQEFVEPYGFN